MNTVGVFLFVFGLIVCCISAYPSAISSLRNVRMIRAAVASPDPHHHHHSHHHGGYESDYGGHQSYPQQNYGHSQAQAHSNAQAGSISTPFGTGAYSQASAGAGSGTGFGFLR